MNNKLVSFIGPRKYIEAYYIYDNKRSHKPCLFIQEALTEFFCINWGEKDEVVVFLTEESKRKNWLGKSESRDAINDKGLKERLEEIKDELKLDIHVRGINIPEGKNEKELWDIFEKINDYISEGDNIIFDVTHSFRSLPILTLVVLNYVRFLKNVKINRIVYGAMEALGSPQEVEKMPLEERNIPIFNLTPFASLFDWTVAIERFLRTGNAEMIRKLGIEELTPLLTKTRGEVGGGLRSLINSLNSFSQNVSTCRAPDFKSSIKKILKSLPKAERELERLKPFRPLFGKIEETFSNMETENEVACGLKVARWCLEKGLIQQGFTILRETIVNYVITDVLNSDKLKKPKRKEATDYRAIAEAMLNSQFEEISPDILNLWNEIREYRNDINHAGWREQNYHKPSAFKDKLRKFIERFEQLVYQAK